MEINLDDAIRVRAEHIFKHRSPTGWDFRAYRKKPVRIYAVRMKVRFKVETKEGIMNGKKGDYLIRGIEGEFYPCDSRIFRKTYAKV